MHLLSIILWASFHHQERIGATVRLDAIIDEQR
jgi:hypothetical protein